MRVQTVHLLALAAVCLCAAQAARAVPTLQFAEEHYLVVVPYYSHTECRDSSEVYEAPPDDGSRSVVELGESALEVFDEDTRLDSGELRDRWDDADEALPEVPAPRVPTGETVDLCEDIWSEHQVEIVCHNECACTGTCGDDGGWICHSIHPEALEFFDIDAQSPNWVNQYDCKGGAPSPDPVPV